MAIKSKQVTSYQFFIGEGLGQKAYISCWHKNKFQGYIDFYLEGNVPTSGFNSGGSFHLAYPIERLDSILTTLREESPVYIQIADFGTTISCRVATSDEPVGEQEGMQKTQR